MDVGTNDVNFLEVGLGWKNRFFVPIGYLANMSVITRYSRWVTLIAAIVLIISCFMPWAYYADLQKSFTGFFSENNTYGKPGKWLVSMALISVVCQFLPMIFLKRMNLLLMALNLAYAIKSYIVYAECYRGYCPEKQTGIYLMLLASVVLMITAVFPSGTIAVKDGPKAAEPAA